MAVNTGKVQGKHREFNLNLNVATLTVVGASPQLPQFAAVVAEDWFKVALDLKTYQLLGKVFRPGLKYLLPNSHNAWALN